MFDNFISLGPWCPTASSMSKYGLRNWSGIFDWLVTPNLAKVLYLLEHSFKDFLLKENLEILPEDSSNFKDKLFEITFMHDKEYAQSLGNKYRQLYEKYQKKIKRFEQELKKKNCFLRAVTEKEELEYILKNKEYIQKIITKNNRESEIVFLLSENLIPCSEIWFRYFVMSKPYSAVTEELLSGYFDGEDAFLSFCGLHYNASSLIKNIAFERTKEKNKCINEYAIVNRRYNLLKKLVNVEFCSLNTNYDIIVFGGGTIGKYFYKKIKNVCSVKYFVDQNKAEIGNTIDGIPVVYLADLKDVDMEITCFVVTATYDYENIRESIKSYFANVAVISLEHLIDYPEIISNDNIKKWEVFLNEKN